MAETHPWKERLTQFWHRLHGAHAESPASRMRDSWDEQTPDSSRGIPPSSARPLHETGLGGTLMPPRGTEAYVRRVVRDAIQTGIAEGYQVRDPQALARSVRTDEGLDVPSRGARPITEAHTLPLVSHQEGLRTLRAVREHFRRERDGDRQRGRTDDRDR